MFLTLPPCYDETGRKSSEIDELSLREGSAELASDMSCIAAARVVDPSRAWLRTPGGAEERAMKTQEVILSALASKTTCWHGERQNAAFPSDEAQGGGIVSVSAEDHLVVIEGFLARKAC